MIIKRIIVSMLCCVVAFIASFAVFCPPIELKTLMPDGECIYEVAPNSGKIITAGTVDANGNVIVSNEMACVVEYAIPTQGVKSIAINFLEKSNSEKTFTVENTSAGNFTDKTPVYANIHKGENITCAEFSDGDITAVRIWITEECKLKSIAFYDKAPRAVGIKLQIEIWRYIIVAVITATVFIAMFLADKFFGVIDRVINAVKDKKSRIISFFAGLFAALVVAAVAELIFRAIFGPDSIGNYFNAASFGMFAAITVCIFIFAFERKNLALKPERVVTLVILLVGFLIIFTEPFSHNSSDEDSHYYMAVQNSFYKEAHLSTADYNVKNTIGFSLADSHALAPSSEKVSLMNEQDEFATYSVEVHNSLPHRLAGTFIAVARLFGADFRTKFVCGQFGMLFIYAATVYFAIKKLKSGKMIMSVIALFPTNILLASNYSYDPWVTGFSLLGTAYLISELEQPEKPITVWETVVMCGAFVLAALPKQLYVVLLILPMFMFKKWKSKTEKRRYYLILTAFFVFMAILFVLRAFSSIAGSGDSRGGEVDPMGQFTYILKNPFEYAVILIKFLIGYLSPVNANKYITFFSYLGDGGSAVVYIVALAFCAVTDKEKTLNRFKGINCIRFVVLAIDFILVCMTATALYISFTPVAYETINGCNPRYLIPLLAPLLLTVANPGIVIVKNKAKYNFIVLAAVVVCTLYKVLTVITLPML